jgi:hypothetical protein
VHAPVDLVGQSSLPLPRPLRLNISQEQTLHR